VEVDGTVVDGCSGGGGGGIPLSVHPMQTRTVENEKLGTAAHHHRKRACLLNFDSGVAVVAVLVRTAVASTRRVRRWQTLIVANRKLAATIETERTQRFQ
jgi:hypothetical protein